jgi:hypothetical protein
MVVSLVRDVVHGAWEHDQILGALRVIDVPILLFQLNRRLFCRTTPTSDSPLTRIGSYPSWSHTVLRIKGTMFLSRLSTTVLRSSSARFSSFTIRSMVRSQLLPLPHSTLTLSISLTTAPTK